MRITSPKTIPLKHSFSNTFSGQYQLQNTHTPLIKSTSAFYTHSHSTHTDSFSDQWTLARRDSITTQTVISNKTTRSRSNHHQGISMVREKTIKLDNIYEPQHFGISKNSQNHSVKSKTIATNTNTNTKSNSRLTRATSPTTTSYPQRMSSQKPINSQKKQIHSQKRTSIQNHTQSKQTQHSDDVFDFKDLKKEINQSAQLQQNQQNEIEKTFQPKANEDYYGSPQLKLNRQYPVLNLTKKLSSPPNHTAEQYNFHSPFQAKTHHKIQTSKPIISREQPKTQQNTIKYSHSHQQNKFTDPNISGTFINSNPHQSQTQKQTTNPNLSSRSSASKLGWRDVIKK